MVRWSALVHIVFLRASYKVSSSSVDLTCVAITTVVACFMEGLLCHLKLAESHYAQERIGTLFDGLEGTRKSEVKAPTVKYK